ncbi:MAG: PIN domain nuclease [Pseudonocardia sp.]
MTSWLIDKSAYTRIGRSIETERWVSRIDRALVRISAVTRMEIGFSARSGRELRDDVSRPPLSLLPIEYLTPAAENRAVEVQQLLADRGAHRAPSVPDLLVAAAAEMGGLTVLHVDKDYDLIAEITGQPVERLRV